MSNGSRGNGNAAFPPVRRQSLRRGRPVVLTRWVSVVPQTLSHEAICTACHGRPEAGEAVVFAQWNPSGAVKRGSGTDRIGQRLP